MERPDATKVKTRPVFAWIVVHVELFVERSILYPRIGVPPVEDGVVHDNVTEVSPAAATRFCGAVAGPNGVPVPVVAVPTPNAVTAEMR